MAKKAKTTLSFGGKKRKSSGRKRSKAASSGSGKGGTYTPSRAPLPD